MNPFGLVRYHVLFVIDIATRCVCIGGITSDPNGEWMKQVARNLTDMWDGFLLGKRYLIHDRDPLFTEAVTRDALEGLKRPHFRFWSLTRFSSATFAPKGGSGSLTGPCGGGKEAT